MAYICQAAGRFGWGHVHRGFAVLEQLDRSSDLVIGSGFEEVVTSQKRFRTRPWECEDEPIDPGEYDVVVVDDYEVSAEWLAAIASKVPTYIVDDWMRSKVRVTGFINPNVGASRSDYSDVDARQWLLGSKYALMRREVCEAASTHRRQDFSNHVLVTLGGSDPDGRTREVTDELCATPWFRRGGRLTVVLGSSYNAPIPWNPAAESVEIVRNPPDYLHRCRSADLVLCSASTVSHEMALLGVPFVPLAFVENQRVIAQRWKAYGIGRGFDVASPGWAREIAAYVVELMGSPRVLQNISIRGAELVDGAGPRRLVESCREMLN